MAQSMTVLQRLQAGLVTGVPPQAADRTLPADEPFVPVRRRRLAARRSRTVDLLTAVHSSALAWPAAAVDLLVLGAVVAGLRVAPLWFDLAFPVLAVVLAYLGQVYADRDSVQTRGALWYPGRVIVPVGLAAGSGAALGSLGVRGVSAAGVAALAVTSLLALLAVRCLTWCALVPLRRRGLGLRSTLVVGDADTAATVWRRLVEFPEAGLVPIQLLTFDAAHVPGALAREYADHRVEHVVLVAPGPAEAQLTAALPRERSHAPFFSAVPALSELFLDPRSVTEVGGIPLMPLGRVTRTRQAFPGKRILDVTLTATGLLLLVPLVTGIALAIRLGDGGPVFYRQQRVGRGGRLFPMLKFRTMVVGADRMLGDLGASDMTDGLLFKLRDDPRVTRVGRWLRKTSLDELPQLWNVLCGTMSLVGPRPLPVEPEDFADADRERHSVLPGITGYWQLSGGPELTYGEMVRLDLAYIRNWSLWLDMRLLLRTVPALASRHGAV